MIRKRCNSKVRLHPRYFDFKQDLKLFMFRFKAKERQRQRESFKPCLKSK